MAGDTGATTILAGGLAAAILILGAGSANAAGAPAPTKPVDAKRFYSGVWREIGRRPIKLTDGCVAGATEYTITTPTRVRVRDTCTKGTPSGHLEAIGGPARILDPGTNAKLRVSYRFAGLIPVDREFWVLDHADDYSWFISADPTFKDLWIYTRDPRVSEAQRAELVAKAKAMGYDVSQLEFPAQP
jgi:apolipoprotein D and lipocalin family protein